MAVFVTAVAVWVRYALTPWLGPEFPFITLFPAAAVVVFLAGVGPAIFGAILGALAANALFLPARFALELGIESWLGVHAIYLASCASIIAIGGIARYQKGRVNRAHRALMESESRFRQIADSTPALLWICNERKEGTYFNGSWLTYTGRRIDQELGSGWLESVHPDDISSLESCEQAFRARRPFTTQFRLRSAAGEYRWMLDNGMPRIDASGEFLGFIGTCTDIHDKRTAEEARGLFASIVDTSDDAIVSKTLNGIIMSWNGGAERLFGYSAAEAVGQSINLIIPASLREDEQRILERLRRGERIAPFETTRVRKDGAPIELSVAISPVRDSSGNIIGASKIARSIADRKRAEENLRASEERYRALVNSQSELLCRFRADGTILFCNEPYARSFSTTSEALIGRVFWDFIPPEEHGRIKETIDGLTKELPEARVENRLKTADGVRWTLWTNRALSFDQQGRVIELQSTGFDITERKEMEEALRRANVRKSEFLAILGHELRNPLAPLRTGLELLERLNRGDDVDVKNVRDMMRRQLNHLVYLVDDLLDVSRISRDRIELRHSLFDVRTSIENAVELARPGIVENEQVLTQELADRPMLIDGDQDRVAQIVGNLLSNAAKYSDPGGTISLSADIEDGAVVIRVRDTGFGIPVERLEEIFEMFNQVPEHQARSRGGGLGIGLSISRALVLAHGGSIEAKSDGANCGSEFIVRLPLTNAAASPPLEISHPLDAKDFLRAPTSSRRG
jgi:PAS domain S-box-containing protein